jgi:hypothetical protein
MLQTLIFDVVDVVWDVGCRVEEEGEEGPLMLRVVNIKF